MLLCRCENGRRLQTDNFIWQTIPKSQIFVTLTEFTVTHEVAILKKTATKPNLNQVQRSNFKSETRAARPGRRRQAVIIHLLEASIHPLEASIHPLDSCFHPLEARIHPLVASIHIHRSEARIRRKEVMKSFWRSRNSIRTD